MNYSEWAIEGLIKDYRHDFGVDLSRDDAIRMMILFDMLAEVFEKYEEEVGDDAPAFFGPLLGI